MMANEPSRSSQATAIFKEDYPTITRTIPSGSEITVYYGNTHDLTLMA